MSELIFRRANENDAETVGALTHAAYAKSVPVIGRRPKPMNVNYEQAVQTRAIKLAYEDGVLVALYRPSRPPTTCCWRISRSRRRISARASATG